jgi:hypothetical protein
MDLSIVGSLQSNVTDSKHKLARDMGRQTRRAVKEAGGKVVRFEVTNGHVFVTLKDDNGLRELKTEFSAMPEVVVQEVTPLMRVFLKSAAAAQVKA